MPSQSAEDEEEGKREDEEGQKRKIDKKQKTKSDLEVPLAAVGARDSLLFFSEMSKYLRTDNVNDNNYREAGSAKDQTSHSALDQISVNSTIQLRVTKSVEDEPFGIVIQGGIDAPYIDRNGEQRTQMRVKEIRKGGAAAREKALKGGMEVRRVNNVNVENKTHKEIADLIRKNGNHLSLDVVINKSDPEAKASLRASSEFQDSVNNNLINDNTDNNNVVRSTSNEQDSTTGTNDNVNNDVLIGPLPLGISPIKPSRDADVREGSAGAADGDTEAAAVEGVDVAVGAVSGKATGAGAKPVSNRYVLRELERQAEKAHNAANAAIVRASAAADAANVAAKNFDIEAAREEIERKLIELETLSDSLANIVAEEERVDEEEGEEEEEDEEESFAAAAEARETSSTNNARQSVAASLTPRSNIMWGTVATHVLEPSFTIPWSGSGRPSTSSSPTTTPSPYHIPTPSPLRQKAFDGDEVENDPLQRQRRSDTPYPICFPSLPSGVGGAFDHATGRKTPGPPPEIRVVETLKEVVEKTPFERPLTAWSIHDPTEEGRGGEGGGGGNGRASQTSLISDLDYLDPTFESSANQGSDSEARLDVSKLDPLSEAASCKWRPSSPETRRKRKTSRTPSSVGSSTPSSPKSLSSSSSSRPALRRGDQMYLFVGSLTLVAASAMIGLFVTKNYK